MRITKNNQTYAMRRGALLLEAALVLPCLLTLTFGACEWGYYLFAKQALQGAAREGARAAIVSGATATTVQTAVDTSLQNSGFAQTTYTRPPTITDASGNAINFATVTSGTAITVKVNTTWSTIGFQPALTIASTKAMSAAATMRRE